MAFKCRIIESRSPLTLSEQEYSVHEIDHFSESFTYGIAIEIDGQIYEATIEHSTKAKKHFRKKVLTCLCASNEVRFVKDNSLHEKYIDALLKDNLILSKIIVHKQEYPCHFHLCCKRLPNCNRKVRRNINEYPLIKYFDICERGTLDPTGLIPDIVLRSSTNEKRIAWVEVLDTHGCEPLKLLKTRYPIYEVSTKLSIDEREWVDDDELFRYYPRFSVTDINTCLCGIDAFNNERRRQTARQITLEKQMPVGRKYKGWTMERILRTDPEYIAWMKRELQDNKKSFNQEFTLDELENL